MVQGERYLLYDFEAVPVPMKNVTKKLQVEKKIAYIVFVPGLCTGARPQVCRTGPVYEGWFRCEQGLVNGHAGDREHRTVQQIDLKETLIQENAPGEYRISTLGEDYTTVCKGSMQRRSTIPSGAYIIKVPSTCVVTTDNWSIKGEVRRLMNATVKYERLDLIEINLSSLKDYNDKVYLNIDKVHATYLERMLGMNESNPAWYDTLHIHTSKHLPYANVLIIIGIILLIAILAYYLKRRWSMVKYICGKEMQDKIKRKLKRKEELELQNVKIEQNDEAPKIYP